ncbi:uncharacterized protein DS421_19g663580 [Arachis hypogaea]|uniref:Secreted protein n=1 Tax=Arachis hypogaea TaxID=3818 RepID=A0A6B9VBZ9_ARAHY|nr:uncharacterized protein DS421_19g663580 [Arachis hypogaea]
MRCCLAALMLILVNRIPTKPFQLQRRFFIAFPICPSRGNSKTVETVKNYRRILKGFEVFSILKINFDKIAILVINCSERWRLVIANVSNF